LKSYNLFRLVYPNSASKLAQLKNPFNTPLLFLFLLLPLSISATSQTEKIKHHLTSTPFTTTLLAEQNKHLSTIAQYGFPAIVTIFSDQKKSIGSGFIISKNGHILTSHQLIQNTKKLKATLQNNITIDIIIIGSDPKTDIALLKIKGKEKKYPYLEFADSDNVKIGEFVIALGNPSNTTAIFTTGIINAHHTFIETHASTHPKNSGGPLLNIYGKIIGINTTKTGIAIPINRAQPIIETLKKYGKVIRSHLGINTQELTPQIATSFGRPNNQKGVLVTQIIIPSPAKTAGLESGDIILTFNSKPIRTAKTLKNIIALSPTNKTVPITFLRGKIHNKRIITLEPELNKNDIHQNQKTSVQGISVSHVFSEKKAIQAGLKKTDTILSINNTRVSTPHIAKQLLQQAKRKNRGITLLIHRNEHNQFITID
jgi:serine protease Do